MINESNALVESGHLHTILISTETVQIHFGLSAHRFCIDG